MEITLIRHGESLANVSGRWQGQGDSPLSPTGREQAQALATRLKRCGTEIDLLISSDLSRAFETASAIGRALEVPVERDPAFREIDVGSWEGLTVDETMAQFPDQVLALRAGESVKVGGGESWPELHDRVDAAFMRIRKRVEPGTRVVIVAHGGVISALVAGFLELRERRPRPLGRIVNTSVTTFRVEGRSVELVTLNDAAHTHDEKSPRSIEGSSAAIALSSLFDPGDRYDAHLRSWAEGTNRLHCSFQPDSRSGSDIELRAFAENVARASGRTLHDASFTSLRDHYDEITKDEGLAGVMTSPDAVRQFVLGALHDPPRAHIRLAKPRTASITHVLATKHGPLLADYNVLPRSHPDH